jgi:myosin heavy subunit
MSENKNKNKLIFFFNYFRFLAIKKATQLRAEQLARKRNDSSILIQTNWRRFAARRRLAEMKRCQVAAVTIQTSWRGCKARREYAATMKKIVKVQALARMRLAVVQYQTLRRSVVLVQARWRRRVAQKSYQKTVKAVVTLQTHTRR